MSCATHAGGRTVECYSESPFLVTEMALQQAKGLSESGIGVSPKHFCVYSIPNGGRDGLVRTDPHVHRVKWNRFTSGRGSVLMQEVDLTGGHELL